MGEMCCSVSGIIVLTILSLTLDANQCGATDNRIVGGRPATEGEFPYQVSLRRSFNDKHFCGGSLITEHHVLTAAHCMFYQWGGILPPMVVSVVAGQLNLTMKDDTQFRNASQIIIHPHYNKTSMENDVALIKLSESFPIDHFISVIQLAETDTGHTKCVVSGWGVQEFESTTVSESLLATEVTRISNERCDTMYGNGTIMESMMCAHDEEGEHDACQGDSGGPLVCGGQLLGVISTGEGCADERYPGIYASVPFLHEWITHNVELSNAIESTTEVPTTTVPTETTEAMEQGNVTTTIADTTRTTSIKSESTGSIEVSENSTVPSTTMTEEYGHHDTKGIVIGNDSRIPDEYHANGSAVIKMSLWQLMGTMTFLMCYIRFLSM